MKFQGNGEKKEGRAGQEGKREQTVEAHKFLKENTLRERESKINDWPQRKLGPGPRNKEPDKIQVH